MRKLFQKVLSLAMIAMIVPSCGNPAKMAEKADQLSVNCTPEVLEVVAGKVNTQVSVVFPAEFFHPKAIVEVQPVIVYNGGEVAGELVMLQGEDVTENYITVAEAGGTVTRNLTFDYVPGMEKSHLELRMTVLHKDKRIPFTAAVKVADGANTTYMLASQNGTLAYAPDAYQPVISEQNETQILYLINSANVRNSQLKSEDVKAFQAFLDEIKNDERRTVVGTDIISYASPDGKEDQNAALAEKRSKSAMKAYERTINKKAKLDVPVNSETVAEDWAGFQELVRNSDIADKELILRVLEMYNDPMVREREIKNMSRVYTTLAKEVLPQLRRARFIANIEFQNYSDAELLELVNTNIEQLDEEALLHTASLVKELDAKVSIYNQAISKYNSDRAKVNKAVALLLQNKNNEAAQVLANVVNKDGYYYNTLGVVALRAGNYTVAAQEFAKSSLKEARYNLGILDILNGNYAAAAKKLEGQGHHDEALAYILNGDLNKALGVATHKCAKMSYLKAIVYARQGNVEAAKAELEAACANEALAERAANDIEFAKIR
jgi:hypothetical protein